MQMKAIALGAFLLVAAATAPARQASTSTPAESIVQPDLPVIDNDACPGKGRIVPNWRISRDSPMYSSWQDKLTKIGRLKAGEKVTVIAGLNITRKPDRILVTRAKPDLSLIPGDLILRYDTFAEGEANIWAKGVWHEKYDLWMAIEAGGTGCRSPDACDSVVIESGVKEWWVQVKTSAGQTGWVQSHKITRGTFSDSRNFDNLCAG